MRFQSLAIGLLLVAASADADTRTAPETLYAFYDNDVHFTPDDPTTFDTESARADDNGRYVVTDVTFPDPMDNERLFARVRVRPIPKELTEVHDKWDRAGALILRRGDGPDVELVKFITSYGGTDDHEVDITHLRPLLVGECEIAVFIDTWVSPAWKVDVQFEFRPRSTAEKPEWSFFETRVPDWVEPVFFEQSVNEELMRDGPVTTDVVVPEGLETVTLYYLVSGHCTDGRGADEFVSKDNVITVDGDEAYRYKPWREDCREYRDKNPYTRRWSNGWWSADFSRSGWCPGDDVAPKVIDLSDRLAAGNHTIGVAVEDVRPKVDEHLGYWRVSGVLVGWSPAPEDEDS